MVLQARWLRGSTPTARALHIIQRRRECPPYNLRNDPFPLVLLSYRPGSSLLWLTVGKLGEHA